MLGICFAILSLTVALGAYLASGGLYRLAILHGVSGAAGLIALLLVLRRGMLKGPFALDAVVLLAGALAGGLLLWVMARRRRGRPALLLFLHASAGGLGYLLLAGFMFGR